MDTDEERRIRAQQARELEKFETWKALEAPLLRLLDELDGGKRLMGAEAKHGPPVTAAGVSRVLANLKRLDSKDDCRLAEEALKFLGPLGHYERIDSASRAAVVEALLPLFREKPESGPIKYRSSLEYEAVSTLGDMGREARVALPMIFRFCLWSAWMESAPYAIMGIISRDPEDFDAIKALAGADKRRRAKLLGDYKRRTRAKKT